MTGTKKAARNTAASDKAYEGFSGEERAAMKDHAREMKSALVQEAIS